MRTTLTLDEDVAAVVERIRRTRNVSLRALINDALRRGLQQMTKPPEPGAPFATAAVSLGRCRLASLDDISEVLAVAESESFK